MNWRSDGTHQTKSGDTLKFLICQDREELKKKPYIRES